MLNAQVQLSHTQVQSYSSEEGRDDGDEAFTPAGTHAAKATSARTTARTPSAKARSSRHKRSPWSQTRRSRVPGQGRNAKTCAAEAMDAVAREHDGDSRMEDSEHSLFGAWRPSDAEDTERANERSCVSI